MNSRWQTFFFVLCRCDNEIHQIFTSSILFIINLYFPALVLSIASTNSNSTFHPSLLFLMISLILSNCFSSKSSSGTIFMTILSNFSCTTWNALTPSILYAGVLLHLFKVLRIIFNELYHGIQSIYLNFSSFSLFSMFSSFNSSIAFSSAYLCPVFGFEKL